MATIKRYISMSPLTLAVKVRGKEIHIPFTGKDVSNKQKQFFFETKTEELQDAIEASPMLGKYFRKKYEREVDDDVRALTKDPVLPQVLAAEAIKRTVPKPPKDEEPEPEEPVEEVTTTAAETPEPGPNVEIPEAEQVVKTETEPVEETPAPAPVEQPVVTEAPAPVEEVGLELKELKNLPAAKRWLSEKGVQCTPKTTMKDAEAAAMKLGFNLVFNPDLK